MVAIGWWTVGPLPAPDQPPLLDWQREIPFFHILAVNLAVGLLLLVGGLSLGVITLTTLVVNGFTWGFFYARFAAQMGSRRALLLLAPHGVIELAALLLLAAAGFRLAVVTATTLGRSGRYTASLGLEARRLAWTVAIGIALVVLGAAVESYGTAPLAYWLETNFF
jgi:uncharacterized membrane protein SpoIIM required for sporulation